MKIVFCTQNMAPFRMQWMDEVAKYHEVVIYHLDEYESGVNKKYISYVPKRAKVYCEKRKNAFFGLIYNEIKIIEENADVYILDGYGFKAQQHLILTLNKKRIPFIISVDGGFVNFGENLIKKNIKKFIMRKAGAYLSTSIETDKFIRYYAGADIKIYRHLFSSVTNEYIEHEPADLFVKRELRKELGMSDQYSTITVGKFEKRKGFDLLIEAAKKVTGEYKIYFIGASNNEIYQKLITKDIENKIEFIDFCDKNKLKKYYIASDLFILPTREDIWGLVIPEAMANGIPVVTTDRCLAGVAMLEKNEIMRTENIDDIVLKLNEQMNLTDKDRQIIGLRNINKTKEYSIENATNKDIENFKEFQKNSKA